MAKPSLPRRTPLRRVGLIAMAVVCLLVALEIGLRVFLFQAESIYPTALERAFVRLCAETYVPESDTFEYDPDITPPARRIRPHDLLGWTHSPGDHSGTRSYRYLWFLTANHHQSIHIDGDGNRITSPNPAAFDGKPEIHVYGCSFCFGDGISDEETLPWKLQESFPSYRVRNLAQCGFGTVQGLLQLRRSIELGHPPAVAIFVHNPFHMFRNYGTAGWLGRRIEGDHEKALIARIADSGELDLRYATLQPSLDADPPYDEILQVTLEIYREIGRICRENEIVPVLAAQTGVGTNANPERRRRIYRAAASDPVAVFALRRQFVVVNMALSIHASELDPYYRVAPNDMHPNGRATSFYADKITEALLAAGIGP
ncbi:MAG: hypothetical protein KDB80_12095 [Planctomycetes bacterium]|nr:hypothetical protein [Planctomycetota bacterium]